MKTKGFYLMAIIPMLACCFSLFAQANNKIIQVTSKAGTLAKMLKLLQRILIVVTFSMTLTSVHAQGSGKDMAERFTPLSPSAAALYESVNFPVSHATGMVDINIPLFDIKEGKLSLPISISYRSSGLKVGDPAGLIGMGWSLNAEPIVSRQVKGKPDDQGGYLQNPYIGSSIQESNYSYLYDFSRGFVDEEPDDFYYKTLKRSGQFFYKRRSLTDANLGYDIISNPTAPVQILQLGDGFSIVESDGTVYSYPAVNSEIAATSIGGYKSVWKVSEIRSIQGSGRLSFDYYDDQSREHHFSFTNNITIEEFEDNSVPCKGGNYGYYCGMSDFDIPGPVIRRYYGGTQTLSFIGQNTTGGSLVDICSVNGTYNSLAHLNTSVKKLKEINFSEGKLVFEYWKRADNLSIPSASQPSRDSYMLKRILVYRADEAGFTLNKKIELYQSGEWNREVLDSIQIFDSANTLVDKYKFEYDNTLFPPYPYVKTDHWGYHNNSVGSMGTSESGVIFDVISIPYNYCMMVPFDPEPELFDSIPISFGDHSKEAFSPFTQARMLKKIYYPTGGYTTFTYEPNQWKTLSDKTVEGGGLRIKEIKSFSHLGATPLVRTFRYGKNENGTGFGDDIGIGDYVYSKNNTYLVNDIDWHTKKSLKRTFMANPIVSYFFPSGTPVVYEYVHEYVGTPDNNLGKTVYKFNYSLNYINGVRKRYSNSTPMVEDYRNSHLWGELLEKQEYAFDNEYILKSKEVYTYNSVITPNSSAFGRQIYCKSELVGNSSIVPALYNYYSFEGFSYEIQPSKKNLIGEQVTEYSISGDSVTIKKKIIYDTSNIHFPRKIVTFNSSADSTVTTKWYPTDFTGGIFTKMQVLNMIEPVVEEVDYKNGTIELSRTKTEYADIAYPNYIQKSAILTSFFGNPLSKQVDYTRHTWDGKICEFVFKESQPTSYLWGPYHNYPLGEAINARYDEIAFEGFYYNEFYSKLYLPGGVYYVSDQEQPIGDLCISVWENDRYEFGVNLNSTKTYVFSFWMKGEASYSLSTLNAEVQVLSDNVIKEKGDWKYRRIVFKNATGGLDLLFNTSGCFINALTLHPIDAEMTTYTYKPLIGIGSMTDASGKTIYYEYDEALRLKSIRDQDGNLLKNHIYHYKP